MSSPKGHTVIPAWSLLAPLSCAVLSCISLVSHNGDPPSRRIPSWLGRPWMNRSISRMAEMEVFSKATLSVCPRVCAHYFKMVADTAGSVARGWCEPLGSLWLFCSWECHPLCVCVWGSLAAELSWLTTGQLSPSNWGGARKLASSEKVEKMEINAGASFSGSPKLQEATCGLGR